MKNIEQEIDNYFSDFTMPEQVKIEPIIEPEEQEQEQEPEVVVLKPVEVYAKWVSDYQQSRLESS